MSLQSHRKPIGKTDEWITPRWILDKLGVFDLDPCAARVRPWICAETNYCDNGLVLEWFGRVWLNPPFNRRWRPRWMKKMAEHNNGIMLIPAALETDAFKHYVWGRCAGICALDRRPKFCYIDGVEASFNSGGTIILVAYGQENLQSLILSGLGNVLIEHTGANA